MGHVLATAHGTTTRASPGPVEGKHGEPRCTYSPEVVDQQVENAEDDDEKGGAELGLEAHNNHDGSDSANERHNHPANGPGAAEDEANEKEDEQDAAGQLEVHLAVLLVKLRNAGEGLALPHPGIRHDHQQAADDGEVAEEEVEVEYETVAQGLGDDDGHEAANSVVGVFANDDEGGARNHSDDIADEEDVSDARGNCLPKY